MTVGDVESRHKAQFKNSGDTSKKARANFSKMVNKRGAGNGQKQ
jgi:hypothetical protein